MPADPVLPPGRAVHARWTIGGCVAVAALLGLYTRGRRVTPVDERVDGLLRPRLEAIFPSLDAFVVLSPPPRMLLLCVVLGAVVLVRGRPAASLVCFFGPGLALLTTGSLQELWARQSATGNSLDAYPSGHMTGVAALLTLVTVLSLRTRPPASRAQAWARWLLRLTSATVALCFAVALTTLRHHYVTDVVGGMAVALGVVLSTALAVDALRIKGTSHLLRDP